MNLITINSAAITNPKQELKANKKEDVKRPELRQNEEVKEQRVSSDVAMATLGIHKSPSFGGKKKPDPINQWVKNLPFADELSPEDRRNIANVVRKKDEETDYMKKMIHLICKEMVTPTAVSSLCKHGVMSDYAKNDIDIYYDKVKGQGMSIEDAFVPKHESQAEGQKAAQLGDVFRVDGQDKIYVKTDEDQSIQLKMDAETYLKLYPPVERFASAQGEAGDCYLLSTINSIMENPKARPALYNCFEQIGNSVTCSLPNGTAKVLFPNCKLPYESDSVKYVSGPAGMQMLEQTYGVEFEEKKFQEYDQIMDQEFKKLDKQLEKWEKKKPQDNLALKKQKETKAKIANYQKGQALVEAAKADPQHKLTFVLDDNDDFVMGKYGPMIEDCDKLDPEFKYPSDYYRGGVGGYMQIAAETLGFEAETLDFVADEEEIEDILMNCDPKDYLFAAGTPAEEEGEMESPQNISYSIYSSHAYKLVPFDDENGKRMFKVTNPWNQSHQITMDINMVKEFFSEISIAKVV